jgi:2'-5' RNA ligase
MDSKKQEENLTRCFIALELNREAITEIEEVQKIIKKKNFFYGKFTEPENLHLTLKFLGEISEEKILEIKKKLSEVKIKKFEVKLGEFGVFSEDFLRILWIKLMGKEIWELQSEIDKKMSETGFEKEKRFMSHITIARIKKAIDKKIFLSYIGGLKHREISFVVKDFCLKKSELKEDGPVYTDIMRCVLE